MPLRRDFVKVSLSSVLSESDEKPRKPKQHVELYGFGFRVHGLGLVSRFVIPIVTLKVTGIVTSP